MTRIAQQSPCLASRRKQRSPSPKVTPPASRPACLAKALEMIEEAVVVMDDAGTVLSVNPAFERITGRRQADTVGAKAVFLDLATARRHHNASLAGGADTSFWTGRLTDTRPDGTPYEAAVRVATTTDAAGHCIGWVATIRDETQRLALEAQFHQAQKLEAMGRLAAGIAHDFNNQLTVITGYSDLALRRMPADDPARGSLDHIRKAADRSAALTGRLLGLSRKHTAQPAPTQLNVVLTEIAKPLSRVIGETVRLTVSASPDLGLVDIDRSLFEQAVMNLVINARDAMPGGGRVEIATAPIIIGKALRRPSEGPPTGSYVRVTVSDTGDGMDAQTMTRIFDPFFTTKTEGHGTGLGLAMVYSFVKQSRGYIYVDSELGKGTQFTLYFRCTQAVQPSAPAVATEIPCGSRGETLLIVEDDEPLRALAAHMMRECGYHVLAAGNGQEALALTRGHAAAIDLLITDVIMPDMSGPALVEQVRGIRPETRILYFSGHARSTLAGHGLVLAGDHLLVKPFDLRTLADKVRHLLDADPPQTPAPAAPEPSTLHASGSS
jgi:two-component system, cell cycle sensor histidine kinase and response regulator CckA